MTVFSYTWDATFLAQPADNESINLGASRIRSFKDGVTERMRVDHSWAGDAQDGKHSQVTLRPASSVPPIEADDGKLINVVIGGISELHWVNDVGQLVRLTNQGTPYDVFTNLVVNGTLTTTAAVITDRITFNNNVNFYADSNGLGNPIINFAANSYIEYNSATGTFNFVANGVLVGSFP